MLATYLMMAMLATAWDTVWNFINSPIGLFVVAAVGGWILTKVLKAKPAWKKYPGYIIEGIKYAERIVPDDTDNKSMARLDAALKYARDRLVEITGKALTSLEEEELKNEITIQHAKLEADGNIPGAGQVTNTLLVLILASVMFAGGCTMTFVNNWPGSKETPSTKVASSNSLINTDKQSSDNAAVDDETGVAASNSIYSGGSQEAGNGTR